ncbi:NAD(P)/FAD-dependent oxidoreductase [Sphingopyxis sp. SE2]|uniref:dihydrolipoyl dehydrogenase family protein n=1 Tax=Sphingopyxis sp. SE2 TaxID=1586240 RepID=UPI0028C2ED3C|nr:NAD(P)/FAD-dependent oxidoreductase [Sphingopyxis sp. SE2]MDT7531204.1 NAD(P)/FAD-dependent oxidoreductase [Sphingopyxis sp. SE2]
MNKAYDLIVIGSGTAAMVAANRMAAAGKKVAVIDFRPFGGTCALRGCDPKKMLITGAQVMDDIRRMRWRGVVADDAHIGWRELIEFKRTFTGPVPQKQEKNYADKGVDTYHTHARFTGPRSLEVEGTGSLDASHILIAAGARPAPLGFPGEEHLIDNEGFLELDELPKRLVLVGGGYIASEFSHIAARAGAQVTVLQRGDRILTHFDPDLVGWLMDSFAAVGIDVRTGHSVEAVEKTGEGFTVRARTKDGGTVTVDADLVVHAGGRIPDLDSLELEVAGIERDERGHLKLNEYLQSVSNPSVYAAGDAAQVGPPLTPVSSHDAKVVVGNLLDGNKHRPDYRAVPSVAFTIPPIAAVGLGESEAREKGIKFRVKSERTSTWYTARRVAEPVYGYKVMIEEGSNHIIGAHLVGPHVDEVINVFALAMRHGLTSEDLNSTIFAYPTGASDIGYML